MNATRSPLGTRWTQRIPAGLILSVLGVLCGSSAAVGQIRRPRAEVTALAERPNAHPGDPIRLALKVTLPEGVHTQSNKPSDDTFIPTELTVDPPFTVKEIVWPPSSDLNQAGLDKPLKVFEQQFVIGVEVARAAPRRARSRFRRACVIRRATRTSVIRRSPHRWSGRSTWSRQRSRLRRGIACSIRSSLERERRVHKVHTVHEVHRVH
jgi:hypothetical protein